MKRNELITRTGLSRGRIITGSGENVCDDPDGAGNHQVGSFALDFSGLFGSDGEVVDPFVIVPNLTMRDNEFTVVLADTRGLDGDDLGDDNDLLSDASDPEEEDGAFITDDVQWARIDRVSIDWRFVGPSFADATVWRTDPDTGEIDTAVGQLRDVLDVMKANILELDADADVWSVFRSYLRFTVHWALLVIDCTSVNDQGIADFAEVNSTISVRNNPVPVGGPSGLLVAYGSSSDGTEGMRLWTTLAGGGVRIVARGEREYKYQYREDTDLTDPAAQLDFDALAPEDGVTTPYRREDASTRIEGQNIHINLNLERKITLRDDQLVVLCVQTGRARLARTAGDVGFAPDLVIAGPTLLDGRNGPTLTMYHHYTQVSGNVR